MTHDNETISDDKVKVLVTGATGMQGGAAVQALLRAGHSVTAFVRDPSTAAARALAEQGVTLATGDLDDPASLEAAAAGHDVVFSVQLPSHDPADPGSESRQAGNIAAAAQRSGVTHLIHTSVSATGWRTQYPDAMDGFPAMDGYWDQKEAAEDAIRNSGVDYWTIFKPALYMDNFLPIKQDLQFDAVATGELVTAASPKAVMALISSDDFGAAVAAAVADPDRFQHAEIDLAGDALTFAEIAGTVSRAADREITVAFPTPAEQTERFAARFGDLGASITDSQVWFGRVGYPARPHHAAAYGLTTTTFAQWAARQDWQLPPA